MLKRTRRTALSLSLACLLALPATAAAGVYYDLATDAGGIGASLLAYWRLGETDPTSPVADVTGSYAGTYMSFTAADLGHAGALADDADTAARFQSADTQYITFGDVIIDGRTSLSVGVWVKIMDLTKDSCILAKGDFANNQPVLFWRDESAWASGRSNTYSVMVSTSSTERRYEGPTNASSDTEWHFVAFTYTADTAGGLRLYQDGKLLGTQTTAGVTALRNTSDALTIGASIVGLKNPMEGFADDMVVFGNALTKADVWRLYRAGQGYLEPLEGITTSFSGGLRDLTSLTVLRGVLGREAIPAAELIPVDIVHYNTTDTAALLNAVGGSAPAPGGRATWLNDAALGTGIANVGAGTGLSRDPVPSDPGLGITFRSPLANGPGPDVIIFELDNNDPDPFVVSPWRYNGRADLHPFSVAATDYVPLCEESAFTAYVYSAASPVTSLALLESLNFSLLGTYTGFEYYGYALDLSDLGYLPGEAVPGLFLQSLDPSNLFDPILIVGLAYVPEPGTLALLGAGLLALARRRRRCTREQGG